MHQKHIFEIHIVIGVQTMHIVDMSIIGFAHRLMIERLELYLLVKIRTISYTSKFKV